MAAPYQKTCRDFSGKWVMNKTLSDNIDAVLVLQGVNWMLRKAISLGAVTLAITPYDYSQDHQPAHLGIAHLALAGIKGFTDVRTLDWQTRFQKNPVFGDCMIKSRWVNILELQLGEDPDFLANGWLDEDQGEHLQTIAENIQLGWVGEEIWGFQEIDGKRYYVRHCVVRKGREKVRVRLVYDYKER